MVGDDTYQYAEELKQYVKEHNLEKIVEFVKPTKDIQKIYANTDILVVASRREAFGRVAVEGMLASCLVIGANTAGTKEIIKDRETGILYEQGNIEDLAKNIEYVCMNKKQMNDIIKNARWYAKENFNSQQNADNINKLYHELMAEDGRN